MSAEGDDLAKEFVRGLSRLTPSEWTTNRARVDAAKPSLWMWDEAWEEALGLGALDWSAAAMAAAEAVPGNPPSVQAMAGSAAGALAVRSRLSPRHFDVLYGPFADIIPVEHSEEVPVRAGSPVRLVTPWCRGLGRLGFLTARRRRSYA